MTNFYVPIEIKNREFYSRLLLSLEVCKKYGCNVYFGFRGHVNYFAQNYDPGIYLGLSTVRNFEKIYSDIKKKGNKIFICDEEGLVVYSEKYYKKFKVSEKIINLCDYIFTWGKKNTEFLKKYKNVSHKIIKSGNPRLDLLKKPISKIYENEVKEIKKKYQDFYLICTNFSYNNYFDKEKKYSELLNKRNFFTSKKDFESWKKYEKIKDRILNELKIFLKYSKKVKNTLFVIRCHPSENSEIYKQLAEKYTNVFFDNRFSVHPWIMACKGIINHYCTTTFEGAMCKKLSYTLKHKYLTDLEDKDYFRTTIISENAQKLIINLNKHFKFRINKIMVSYSRDLIKNSKQKSYKIIANYFKEFCSKEISKISETFILKYKILNFYQNLKNLILFRKNYYVDQKIKNIKTEEIKSFINFFPKYKNLFKIRKINKNFFLISR